MRYGCEQFGFAAEGMLVFVYMNSMARSCSDAYFACTCIERNGVMPIPCAGNTCCLLDLLKVKFSTGPSMRIVSPERSRIRCCFNRLPFRTCVVIAICPSSGAGKAERIRAVQTG